MQSIDLYANATYLLEYGLGHTQGTKDLFFP